MKVLLDLSTLLTYWLWWMPLSVIWDTTLDKYILATNSNLQLNDLWNIAQNKKDIEFSYVCWEKKFASCVYSGWTFDKELFLNQKKWLEWYSDDFCVSWNMLFSTNNYPWNSQDNLMENWCPKISTLLEKSRWFTWPFFGLVGSLLNIWTLVVTPTNKTIASLWVEFIIKSLIWIALIIPLLVLAVVLVVRVVVIWMITAFSPLIILSEIFGFKVWWDKASLSSILWLIFLPVTAVFAVSISLVFLSLLINHWPQVSNDWKKQSGNLEMFWLKLVSENDKSKCYETVIWNKLCLETANQDAWISFVLNNFSWLIINLLWIWLMWTIVFASMKTSKITNNIVSWVEGFAKSTMKTLPIIPAPWWGLSIWAVKQWLGYAGWLPDRLITKNYSDRVQPYLTWIQEKMAWEQNKDWEMFDWFLSWRETFLKAASDFTKRNTSWTFSDYQQATQALSKFTKDSWLKETSDIMEALKDNTFRGILMNAGINIEKLVIWNNKLKDDDLRKELRDIDPKMLSTQNDETGDVDSLISEKDWNKILFDWKKYTIIDSKWDNKWTFEDNDNWLADLITEWKTQTGADIKRDEIEKAKKK